MDIRDTVSRVLLGIAFGFVMGIVMYQASGIDADMIDKSILRAQIPVTIFSTGTVDCGGQGESPGPSGCCAGFPNTVGICAAPCTIPGIGGPGCPSSSAFSCPSGTTDCNGIACCTAGQYCTLVGCAFTPVSSDPPSSSSSFSPSSSGGSSSGGCCDTASNSCA